MAVPIIVEGTLWGSMGAGTEREQFPADAEQRVAAFTELAGTAIANADSRSELAASRARVVAASDETRRQIYRDLHDGAQQRLVHTVGHYLGNWRIEAFRTDGEGAPALVAEALEQAQQATVELRELVHGVLPPILTRGGLRDAVMALVARMPVPVEVSVPGDRFPRAIEATAYFVIAEALTNVVKHSVARQATVLHASRTVSCRSSGYATTASAAPAPTAPASSGSPTGSPPWRASSGSRAQPAAGTMVGADVPLQL